MTDWHHISLFRGDYLEHSNHTPEQLLKVIQEEEKNKELGQLKIFLVMLLELERRTQCLKQLIWQKSVEWMW